MNVDRRGGGLGHSEDEEISEIMRVAARAERTLRPVQPAPAFRARLRDGLMMAAHHQEAHRLLTGSMGEPVEIPHALRENWGLLIGAAAIGSAAGVLAVVLRSRAQTHKPAAQPQMQQQDAAMS